MAVNWEEKRRFPRVSVRVPLRFQMRGVPEFDNTISDNLSAQGISFASNRFIPLSSPVMLEISLLSRLLRAVGRIAWTQAQAHSELNRIGVEFLEMEKSERRFIEEYIEMQLSQQL